MGLYKPYVDKGEIPEEHRERINHYLSKDGQEELKSAIETLRKLNDNQLVLYFHRLFAEDNGNGLVFKRMGSVEMYGNILFKAYITVMKERNCKFVDIKSKDSEDVGYRVFTKKPIRRLR